MSLHFDFVDLRLFVYIAEESSLTKAAARIHISLPAASMRIKKLEQSVGIPLLNRAVTGISLLPAGKVFLHHARLVLSQVELLGSDLQEYAKGVIGHVRILANTTAMTEFLPKVLSNFLAERPNVNINLSERSSADIVKAVTAGAADLGIVANTVSTVGLQTIPYKNSELVLVVGSKHSLFTKKEVSFEEVIEENFISLHEGSAIHSFLETAAKQLNKKLKVRIQLSSFDSLCRMVAANVGIGVLPKSLAEDYAKHSPINCLHIENSWAKRSLLICMRDLDSLPLFTKELVDKLRNESDVLESL